MFSVCPPGRGEGLISQSRYPPSHPKQGQGYPPSPTSASPSQDRGTLPLTSPHNPTDRTRTVCGAGGMPLAVTQQDCLISIKYLSFRCLFQCFVQHGRHTIRCHGLHGLLKITAWIWNEQNGSSQEDDESSARTSPNKRLFHVFSSRNERYCKGNIAKSPIREF